MNSSFKTQTPFPSKLFQLLDLVDVMGLSCIISWLPHGRAFMVHDEGKFMSIVLPSFCNATQIRSFSRQLNLWGFKRIPSGKDAGAWFHESFLRGKPEKLANIVRTKIKGAAGMEARRNSEIPDFYAMEPLNDIKGPKNNEFHEKHISKAVADGTVSPFSSKADQAFSKYCVECSPRSHMHSTQNVFFDEFSDENPGINKSLSAYRPRRVSLDPLLDSNTSGAQNSHRAERSGFQDGFSRRSSCPPDFTPRNGGHNDPFEFVNSPLQNAGCQVQSKDMAQNVSDLVQSHSDFHQVFSDLSESFEDVSAGADDDNLEPLPVAISYEDDEFVSFINRAIQNLS